MAALGADALGERNRSSEQVGRQAAEQLQYELDGAGTVDSHTADNLMVWAALFGGHYTFGELTDHITTNAWVIEQFLPGALQVEANTVRGNRS